MIQLLPIDTIGVAYVSTVHKHTTPDVDNSNILCKSNRSTETIYNNSLYVGLHTYTKLY